MKYVIEGKTLHCPHCGGEDFDSGEAQLNTAGMSLLGLDFLNTTARTFACRRCGRIEWFTPEGGARADDRAEETSCLSCGERIPAGEDRCPACGWSYHDAESATD